MGDWDRSPARLAAFAAAGGTMAFALAEWGHRWIGLALLADACVFAAQAWRFRRGR